MNQLTTTCPAWCDQRHGEDVNEEGRHCSQPLSFTIESDPTRPKMGVEMESMGVASPTLTIWAEIQGRRAYLDDLPLAAVEPLIAVLQVATGKA